MKKFILTFSILSILSILFTNCSKTDEISTTTPIVNNQKILFNSETNDISDLYTMNIDGTNETQITNFRNGANPIYTGDASWSSDGTKIIFVSEKTNDNGSSVYIINADGTNLTRVNHKTKNESNPNWK